MADVKTQDEITKLAEEAIRLREKATPLWSGEHGNMRHWTNDIIGTDCCDQEPFVLAQMNRNMENWKTDLDFILFAANNIKLLAEQNLRLLKALEAIEYNGIMTIMNESKEYMCGAHDAYQRQAEIAREALTGKDTP